MKALGYIFTTLMLILLSAIWSGFVLSVLWGWLIVPTFGVPPIGVAQAIGISLIISYLTHQMIQDNDKDSYAEQLAKMAGYAITKPLFALVTGWVVSLFI